MKKIRVCSSTAVWSLPMPKIYRKVKKQPSIFLPVTMAIIGAVGLCFASQAYDASKKQHKAKEVVLIEEVPLGEYSVLKQLPVLKTGLECDSKCFKKKKREQNNMTEEQINGILAYLFTN